MEKWKYHTLDKVVLLNDMKNQDKCTITLTREELYERVWTTAMRHLGPELGVSDVGLKKICKRFDIPTPPVGYWAKKEHGKATRRPRLPDCDDPSLEGIKFWPNGGQCRIPGEEEEYVRFEKTTDNRIKVPSKLTDPDPLVERTLRSLKAASPDDNGLVSPRAKKTIQISVAPENIDRAILIIDTLVKSLAEREMPVMLQESDGVYQATVTVRDETIAFMLGEHTKREERELTKVEKQRAEQMPMIYGNDRYFHYLPTGRLFLRVLSGPSNGGRRTYADTSRQKLEGLLNAFIICFHRTAEDIKTERIRIEERRREWEEKERIRREKEAERQHKLKRIHEEETRLKELFANAEPWEKSQAIRRYIEAFREAVTSSCCGRNF